MIHLLSCRLNSFTIKLFSVVGVRTEHFLLSVAEDTDQGLESVVITKDTGMSPVRQTLFDFLGRNSARVSKYFNLPSDKVFEIGSRIRL